MDNIEIRESYNEISYKSRSFTFAQPCYLKSILKLLSFDTPDVSKARILEIGSSFGGNILPIAINFPDTEIYGIDLSEVQVKKGNEIIKEIGLKNIKLIAQNILEFNNDLGKFDYIICHGVFSWVPDEVANKILDVISKNLSKNGVAIISYNTYPGWAKYDIYRNFMNFRIDYLKTSGVDVKKDEIMRYSRGALEFLKEYSAIPKEFKDSVETILEKEDDYLIHEYHELYNKPYYLWEFNKKINQHNLSHICDAYLFNTFKDKSLDAIEIIGKECGDNLLAKEQYYDYLSNTQFRRSIITKKGNMYKINLTEKFNLKDILNLYISGYFEDDKNDELLKYLKLAYPSNVQIKEIYEKFGKDSLEKILLFIISDVVKIFPYKVDKDKIYVDDVKKKYIKTCIKNSDFISLSTYNGTVIMLNDIEEILFTNLEEFNDEEKMRKEILKMFEDGLIHSENTEEVSLELVKKIRAFLKMMFI